MTILLLIGGVLLGPEINIGMAILGALPAPIAHVVVIGLMGGMMVCWCYCCCCFCKKDKHDDDDDEVDDEVGGDSIV